MGFGDKMAHPLFTCVVPVKGPRPYFEVAMESLRSQGMGDDLEIIVQDGDIEPDAGQSDALNRGFAKARGEWLFWLNADDVLLPGALKAVRALIDRKGDAVQWIAGNLVYLDPDGRVMRCTRERGARRWYEGLPVRVFGPSSFFRRELFARCGPLDTSLRYCMDTDLWNRFRAAGAWYVKLPRYVWGFRRHGGSKTSGALAGEVPDAMRRERAVVNGRAGVRTGGVRTGLLRIVRLADGSTARSVADTLRWRGRDWKAVRG